MAIEVDQSLGPMVGWQEKVFIKTQLNVVILIQLPGQERLPPDPYGGVIGQI